MWSLISGSCLENKPGAFCKKNLPHKLYISICYMVYYRQLNGKSFSNHFGKIRGVFEVQTSRVPLIRAWFSAFTETFPAILWLFRKTSIQGLNRTGRCPNGSKELMSAEKRTHLVYFWYIIVQIACLFPISNMWFWWTRHIYKKKKRFSVNKCFFSYEQFYDPVIFLLILIWKKKKWSHFILRSNSHC